MIYEDPNSNIRLPVLDIGGSTILNATLNISSPKKMFGIEDEFMVVGLIK